MANIPVITSIFLKVTPPEGTEVGPSGSQVTIAGTSAGKPADALAGAWETLATVGPDGFDVDVIEKAIERRIPRKTGGYTSEKITSGIDGKIAAKLNDLNSHLLGIIFGNATANAGTTKVPFLTKRIRRWHLIEMRNQAGLVVFTGHLWGDGYVEKTGFGEKITETAYVLEVVSAADGYTDPNAFILTNLSDMFAT